MVVQEDIDGVGTLRSRERGRYVHRLTNRVGFVGGRIRVTHHLNSRSRLGRRCHHVLDREEDEPHVDDPEEVEGTHEEEVIGHGVSSVEGDTQVEGDGRHKPKGHQRSGEEYACRHGDGKTSRNIKGDSETVCHIHDGNTEPERRYSRCDGGGVAVKATFLDELRARQGEEETRQDEHLTDEARGKPIDACTARAVAAMGRVVFGLARRVQSRTFPLGGDLEK